MIKKLNGDDEMANLRNLAEEIAENEIQIDQALPFDEPDKLVQELRVHQIELEMQNDELRRTQEELEISRAKYFDLYDLAPIGYFTASKQGLITELNLRGAELLGSDRKTIVKQPFTDFIAAEDQDIYYLRRKNLLETGEPQTFELRMQRRDASFFWARLEISASVEKATCETIHRIIISDITERKLAEEARLNEARYYSILEGQTELICRYLPNGKLSFANSAYARYYKKDQAELINKNFIPHIPEPDLSTILKKIKEITKDNPTVEYTHRILLSPSNETRWQRWTQQGIFSPAGQLIEYQAVGFDITNHQLAEEKVKDLLQEKELLLKEVHHRIKNNMNAVAGFMFLQAMTLKDPIAIAALKDAKSRVLSMMLLYDKLYVSDYFKEIPFKEYFSTLIDQIVAEFPNKDKIKIEKNIDNFALDTKKSSELGIIVNEILTNIMKYAFTGHENGLIAIAATANDNRATVTISDNGIGIPESVDITNPNGFGLMLVKTMIRQLHGTIKVERNNGTKFILEFTL